MTQQITCPKCSHKFALDEAINREVELHLRAEISAEFRAKELRLRETLRTEAVEKASLASAELALKIEAQTKELKETREHESALLRKTLELEDRVEKAELDAQRKLAEERGNIRRTAQEQLHEEHRLKDAEKTKQLDDMRRQIEELQRKAEQNSPQLQGDVQEQELEKNLRERFPRDVIEPVKSGVRGADVFQRVIADSGHECGTILWESKCVRNWSEKWIDKLIEDKQSANADIAVLVTDALPAHLVHMGSVRGVLITTFRLAACLAETLRVNMSMLARTRLALTAQDDQKSRVFQYFTSPEFHNVVTTIAEQFQQMQADLAKEKASMTRTWAKREKQIGTVVSSTARFAGGLQALYGSQLPELPAFDLPGFESVEESPLIDCARS